MDLQAKEISDLTGEVNRLKGEIAAALKDFDDKNGGAAIQRLRDAITPKPFVHILRFPATARELQTRCGVRKFGETDLLVGDEEQARGVSAGGKYILCEPCTQKRTLP
jgi:hypothetical protein